MTEEEKELQELAELEELEKLEALEAQESLPAPVEAQESLPAPVEALKEEPEIGATEAALRHGAASATLGLSDVVAGAAGAAGHAYGSVTEGRGLPSKEELLKTYYEAQKEEEKFRDKAIEQQPVASYGAMLAGGFATPIPGAGIAKMGKVGAAIAKALPSYKGAKQIGKAGQMAKRAKMMGNLAAYYKYKRLQHSKSLKMALREGVKGGTIAGVAYGDSKPVEGIVSGDIDTLKQETKKAVWDAVEGGTLGAAFSAGVILTGIVPDVVRRAPILSDALDSFAYGVKGKYLSKPEVARQIELHAAKMMNDFKRRISPMIKQKDSLFKFLDSEGITLDTSADLIKAREAIHAKVPQSERKEYKLLLDIIDDYVDGGAANKKFKEKLVEKIRKFEISADHADNYAEKKAKELVEKQAFLKALKSKEQVIPGGSRTAKFSAKEVLKDDNVKDMKAAWRVDSLGDDTTSVQAKIIDKKAPKFQKTKDGNYVINEVTTPEGKKVYYTVDENSGKIMVQEGTYPSYYDSKKLTHEQAKDLLGKLNQYSKIEDGNYPKEMKQAATDAAVAIQEKLRNPKTLIGQRLKEIDDTISKYAIGEEVLVNKTFSNFKSESDIIKLQQKLASFIMGETDTNPLTVIKSLNKQIKEVDPEYAKQLHLELVDLRRKWQLARGEDAILRSTSYNSLIGPVSQYLNKLGNFAGQVTRTVALKPGAWTKDQVAKTVNGLVKATPDQITGIIEKISGKPGAQHFINQLKKAAEAKNPKSRYALLYPLTQQAAFKEMLRDDDIFEEENKEN
jgi:hypothetical protein